jgi:hypothetical protein
MGADGHIYIFDIGRMPKFVQEKFRQFLHEQPQQLTLKDSTYERIYTSNAYEEKYFYDYYEYHNNFMIKQNIYEDDNIMFYTDNIDRDNLNNYQYWTEPTINYEIICPHMNKHQWKNLHKPLWTNSSIQCHFTSNNYGEGPRKISWLGLFGMGITSAYEVWT